MRIPKVINQNDHIYVFVQELKNGLFLYKDLEFGFKESFTLFDLGLVKEGLKPYRKLPNK